MKELINKIDVILNEKEHINKIDSIIKILEQEWM